MLGSDGWEWAGLIKDDSKGIRESTGLLPEQQKEDGLTQ